MPYSFEVTRVIALQAGYKVYTGKHTPPHTLVRVDVAGATTTLVCKTWFGFQFSRKVDSTLSVYASK